MMRMYFAKKRRFLCLWLAGLLWLSSCGEDEGVDETPKYPPRTIRVETNGSSRVLIQQLDPPLDLLVKEMQAGDQAEVIARGPCKLFCSAGEFVRLDNNGSILELGRPGPIAKEF
jgi:hypothetical protein